MDEVKLGRTDFSTIAGPGTEPDEGPTAVTAGKLDADLHLSARKLGHSLGIATSTVCREPIELMGMKC
jgi:hypothetical protein